MKSTTSNQSLSFGPTRGRIEKILAGVLVFILGVFFVKTALWEYSYYSEKEGSARAEAVNNLSSAPDVDETPVTEEDRAAYSVPADHPRYLSIEKLGIKNARVLSMGVLTSGELDTPNNIFDVGWYNASGTPGSGRTLLIDGHNGGPNVVGVFKYLNQLEKGDQLVVERGDGALFTYSVVENNEVPLDAADDYMKTALTSAEPGTEGLTLISCIGEWSQTRQTYLSRQFVRAVLSNKE
ncbi:class F sortase [Candidatus Saccharibacteria bacterium]|nr:class F sortase [Candidatus Saccharibacteria bacterium]